jgi:4-amino-4-deoxy-L-arabinose transferase-like glycosyltransferase
MLNLRNPRSILFLTAVLAAIIGIVLRFYNLSRSGFFFYDEGLYLNHNLMILELIRISPPHGFAESWHALLYYLKMALGSGKSFWFFIIDARFLFGGIHAWNFAKYAAAFFGVLSLPLVYTFAKRFYRSKEVALLAVAIMALLPGAVFYSRIALQEAFSIFLVLSGLYFYFFPRSFGWRTFIAGIILGAAFFSNYRLLMLPMIVLATELWFTVVEKDGGGLRKYIWFCVVFFSCVVLIGSLLDAANSRVIFAWVFHQEQMAGGRFSWVNLLSYPYYLFRLETWPFALLFFGNIYFVVRKRWNVLLPFILVLVQMAIFSFTPEKGARYLAVMLPFAVMSVAFLIWEFVQDARERFRIAAILVGAFLAVGLTGKSFQLALASSAHAEAIHYLKASKGEDVKFFSSQELVDVLYLTHRKNVKAVAQNFNGLVADYNSGFHTLILDPQAYVSLCQGDKFTKQLKDYLTYIDGNLRPVKTFQHMNEAFLERFVFEHSENLAQSVRFLADKDIQKLSSIKIYDLEEAVPVMQRFLERWQMLKAKK